MSEPNQTSHANGQEDRPSVRVGGLLVVEGRVVLVRQRRGGEAYWLLPGGSVRFGEGLAEALRREFHEELGLPIASERPVALAESIAPDLSVYAKHVLHVVFAVRLAGAMDLERLAPRDDAVLEVATFSPGDLAGLALRPPIAEFIASCCQHPPDGLVYLGRRW